MIRGGIPKEASSSFVSSPTRDLQWNGCFFSFVDRNTLLTNSIMLLLLMFLLNGAWIPVQLCKHDVYVYAGFLFVLRI